jgi:hypothetical protein
MDNKIIYSSITEMTMYQNYINKCLKENIEPWDFHKWKNNYFVKMQKNKKNNDNINLNNVYISELENNRRKINKIKELAKDNIKSTTISNVSEQLGKSSSQYLKTGRFNFGFKY